ncbi:MAG: hypothetical protein ACK56I_31150, partial [bacterium]
ALVLRSLGVDALVDGDRAAVADVLVEDVVSTHTGMANEDVETNSIEPDCHENLVDKRHCSLSYS